VRSASIRVRWLHSERHPRAVASLCWCLRSTVGTLA